MLSSYQVIFRSPSWPEAQLLQIHALDKADAAARVRAVFPQDNLVLDVGNGTPLVEPIGYTFEEAAAVLHVSQRTLRDYQARGELVRPSAGPAIFPRSYLQRLIEKRMSLPHEQAA